MSYWLVHKRKYTQNWIWISFSLFHSRENVLLIILRKCFQFSFLISLRIIKTDLQTHHIHGAQRPCRGEYLLYVQFKPLSKLFNVTGCRMTSFQWKRPRNEYKATASSGTHWIPRAVGSHCPSGFFLHLMADNNKKNNACWFLKPSPDIQNKAAWKVKKTCVINMSLDLPSFDCIPQMFPSK